MALGYIEYATVIVAWVILTTGLALTWHRSGYRVDVPYVLVFLLALVLRYVSATWGPGDLGMNLESIFVDVTPHSGYGDAPFAVLSLVFSALPKDDRTLIAVSIVIGSLAAPAIGAFIEASGCARKTGLAGAVLIATTPLLVRFAGEAEREGYVIFFSCVALWALARATSAAAKATPLVIYAVAAVLCARSRPEAILVLPMSFLFSAFKRDWTPATWLAHALSTLVASGLLFAPALHGSANPITTSTLHLPERLADLIELGVVFDRNFTPLGFLAAFAVAVWTRTRTSAQSEALRWALAALALLLLAYGDIAQSAAAMRISSARYQTVSAIPFTMVAAIGIECLCRRIASFRMRLARLLIFAGLGALFVWSWWEPFHRVTAKCTVDTEYAFIRQTLPSLPADAVIYYVKQADTWGMQLDTGLRTPTFLSKALGLPDQRWVALQPGVDGETEVLHGRAENGSHPQYYYEAADCSAMPNPNLAIRSRPMFELCRLARAAHATNLFRGEHVPSRPFAHDLYHPDPVPIGFYRINP